MKALRKSALGVALTIICVLVSSCNHQQARSCVSTPAAAMSPELNVRYRMSVVWMHLELRKVFDGRYPRHLGELTVGSPKLPVDPLTAEFITDPFSAHGLPFRYRANLDEPQLASVGPDGRWGGWPSDSTTFFGQDDPILSRAEVSALGFRQLHAAYAAAVSKGDIPSVVMSIQRLADGTTADWESIQNYHSSQALRAGSPGELVKELVDCWRVQAPRDLSPFDYQITGIDSLTAFEGYTEVFSFGDALSTLQETTPLVIEVSVWQPPSALLMLHDPELAEGFAFWELMAQDSFAEVSPKLRPFADSPDDIVIVLPNESCPPGARERMEKLITMMTGQKRRHVFETKEGVAIARLGSWGNVFALATTFREFIPDLHTAVRVLEQVRQIEGR